MGRPRSRIRAGAVTSAEAVSDEASIRAIVLAARAHGFDGFGGACGEAAVALNRVVFGGRAELVGAFNEAFFDRGRLIGHVAVLVDGVFWDGDATPKCLDDIEHWGMLDPGDSDYAEQADEHGIPWTDAAASEIVTVTFETEAELLDHFGTASVSRLMEALETAKAGVALPSPVHR